MSKTTIPAYRIYSVTEKDDGSTSWAEIGVVWKKHKDGKGFTLDFKSRPPVDAQIVLRLRPAGPRASSWIGQNGIH